MCTLKLVKVEWRSGFRTIGFALFQDSLNNNYTVYYEAVSGFNQKSDIEHIRDFGLRMTYEEAKGFFPDLEKETYQS